MTAVELAAPGLSAAEHGRQLRRAMVASTIGTIIEAYDFLLYGQVAGLVFAKLFFPGSDPLTGTLQAFGIYAVGFVARPVGAAIFGHFGDRIGRKATLIATLLLTGLSTFAVGLVPSYATIGIWAAVILTALRFIQGLGIGGEWGGAILVTMEWARTNAHRGFITSWPQWGGPAGLFVANLAVLAFSRLSGEGFLVWGWRIPFLLSIVMVGVGIYIRLGLFETPVFARLLAANKVERTPMLEALKRQPKLIILAALARMAEQGPVYTFAAFVFDLWDNGLRRIPRSAARRPPGRLRPVGRDDPALRVHVEPDRPQAHVSDRCGCHRRLRLHLFFDDEYRGAGLVFLAVVLSFVPHDMMFGPQAALIAECFTARLRYSGASLGFHLSSVVAGGPAPLIATALFAATGSGYAIALFILFCAIVSVGATAFLPDYTNREISAEYDSG
jgi:MFS family permease